MLYPQPQTASKLWVVFLDNYKFKDQAAHVPRQKNYVDPADSLYFEGQERKSSICKLKDTQTRCGSRTMDMKNHIQLANCQQPSMTTHYQALK